MNCPKCNKKMKARWTEQTLVGYFSPPGHDHDDNCLSRTYRCTCGHSIHISLRRRCSNPDCDWVGKDECFCHKGKKVDEWPK
jgi:hypothetical protein